MTDPYFALVLFQVKGRIKRNIKDTGLFYLLCSDPSLPFLPMIDFPVLF